MNHPRERLPSIELPSPIIQFYKPSTIDDSLRKRRLSHSAIEKRRRERMNDKIERLKSLIPSCNSPFPTTVQQPIHKLSVLQAAIDYINQLHVMLDGTLSQDDPIRKTILNST
ncbi:hypothetical protein RMATCC62417_08528 [Rhizopus microsporus]|nr:hypothetical protein RMATCC62417_08528 [Rhizopus microsporus]